jgi:signal transduction histidine kinase/CheY-like chemotaxis protein
MAKVLVVDDYASNRELILVLLKHAGHTSLEAADGSVALEQVRAHRPDLVICDILMPTMDGYEFVRQLRADPQIAHTEVIFYTAMFMEREARTLAESCGVSNVLIKPSEPEEILRVIERALTEGSVPAPLADSAEFDREHLRLVTNKLALKVSELESANLRLSALTELNLQLASERDPRLMLEKVCRGARDLLGARYAALAVREKNGGDAVHLATWGLSNDQTARLRQYPNIDSGILGRVMNDRRARRFLNPGGVALSVELPADYPPAQCGLIAPIVSLHRTYGWILLVDKLGADAFTDSDEHLLAIHAAQAGRIYENGSLYREVMHTAEELRVANDTLEQRVKQRTAELHDIIGGLESFTRSVSHDLRGPLGGIAGAARMAREFMAENNTEKADRFLEMIVTQADVTARMVDALLQLARSSDVSLQAGRVDMDGLVREVIQAMHQADPGAPVPTVLGHLAEVDADPALVRQVVVNLIGNALKFTSESPQPQIEVGMTGTAGNPVFFVRDNGVGFDADKAHRLFAPFHRMHGSRFEGSGVGLSIVKRIIDRHDGRVWAESAPGRGATFYFGFGGAEARK